MIGPTFASCAVEKVTGIGGLFFRSQDPSALGCWYQEHLGVSLVPTSYDELPWQQEAGPTAFAPFPEATDYFGDPRQSWMINFRVRNLDAMIAQLRAAGIVVEMEGDYPNGRFARLNDPEGNPIQLWEPQGRNAPGQEE
jgi:catechol 2,3-dioxygenase-like lactoylglutathione lyase family enzyme